LLRYVVNRLLLMIPTLIGVAVLVFFPAALAPATRCR
jgi:ABC-type microcin C transport system permease subunit YejB